MRKDFYPTIKSDVEIRPDTVTNQNVILKGIVFREDLVPLEELRTETMVPNTTNQVKKLHDKPRELQLPAANKRLERTRRKRASLAKVRGRAGEGQPSALLIIPLGSV